MPLRLTGMIALTLLAPTPSASPGSLLFMIAAALLVAGLLAALASALVPDGPRVGPALTRARAVSPIFLPHRHPAAAGRPRPRAPTALISTA